MDSVNPKLSTHEKTITRRTFSERYGKPTALISLIVILAFIISLYLYNTFFRLRNDNLLPSQVAITSAPLPSVTSTPTPDFHQHWQTYTNHALGIQFDHPEYRVVDDPIENDYRKGTEYDINIDEKYNKVHSIYSEFFTYNENIEKYIAEIYKDSPLFIRKGTLSASPYLITEYVLTDDFDKYPTYVPPSTRWLMAPSVDYYISIEPPDKAKKTPFHIGTAAPRIFFDIAETFKFIQPQ